MAKSDMISYWTSAKGVSVIKTVLCISAGWPECYNFHIHECELRNRM